MTELPRARFVSFRHIGNRMFDEYKLWLRTLPELWYRGANTMSMAAGMALTE